MSPTLPGLRAAGDPAMHDGVDAEDPSTAGLLHAIIVELERPAWMLSAENRVA